MLTYQFTRRPLAEALYWALQEDAYYQTMECTASTNPEAAKEAMLRYYDYAMAEGRRFGKLVTLEGEAVGASVWSKPVDEALADQIALEKQTFLLQDMGAASLQVYQAITHAMAEKTKKVVPAHSWYLSILGLAPANQGQGHGGALMWPVLRQTDALSVPTYLETFTPRNVSFYQRLGYKKIAEFWEPITEAAYWVLLREPGEYH